VAELAGSRPWLIYAAALLVAAAAAVFLIFLKALRSRSAIYRYEVRADQRYDFPAARLSRVSSRLRSGSLDIPSPAPAGAVVLLELRVRSTLLGRWFEPYVEIAGAQRRCRQPLERGGAGLRYIELSAFGLAGETSLQLAGHHLEIGDQAVVLHYLRHDVDIERHRMLVIGTHPDDAELAAFGLYADRDAYVITLTAGEAGEAGAFARFGALAYLEKGRTRSWNSVTVPMLGGLPSGRAANLGYFDGTLQTMREHPDASVRSLHAGAEFLDCFGQFHEPGLLQPRRNRRATWSNLVADLEHLLRTIQPEILVAPYPRLDWHPDHKMSTIALVEALKNLNWQRGSLLLYTNHLCTSDRYPFGDAGDLVSLPPGVDGIFFDGIVSVPLDERMQARKHMALDAMVDLRPLVRIDSLRSVAATFKDTLKSNLSGRRIDYFSQAVRANELFLEVRVSSLYEPGVTERIFG
jgi:LmbE family N-acetylglucosaminyl deacetylase